MMDWQAPLDVRRSTRHQRRAAFLRFAKAHIAVLENTLSAPQFYGMDGFWCDNNVAKNSLSGGAAVLQCDRSALMDHASSGTCYLPKYVPSSSGDTVGVQLDYCCGPPPGLGHMAAKSNVLCDVAPVAPLPRKQVGAAAQHGFPEQSLHGPHIVAEQDGSVVTGLVPRREHHGVLAITELGHKALAAQTPTTFTMNADSNKLQLLARCALSSAKSINAHKLMGRGKFTEVIVKRQSHDVDTCCNKLGAADAPPPSNQTQPEQQLLQAWRSQQADVKAEFSLGTVAESSTSSRRPSTRGSGLCFQGVLDGDDVIRGTSAHYKRALESLIQFFC